MKYRAEECMDDFGYRIAGLGYIPLITSIARDR